MNLINDPWIPIIHKSGKKELIRPDQITSSIQEDNPITNFNSPRPDFNGALIQFIIALLQTTFAPEDNEEWENYLDNPPSQEKLKSEFDKVAFAFNLDGDGPRFMQDKQIEEEGGEESDISYLLIDSPRDNTIKLNKDFFIKRGTSDLLCESCSSIALFGMHLNSPAGGPGYRTSIRGGGPLTTIISYEKIKNQEQAIGRVLWKEIWYNIFNKEIFSEKKTDLANIFIWTNQKKYNALLNASSVTPKDLDKLHIFWSMPQRIYLNFKNLEKGKCSICNSESSKNLNSFSIKNKGLNYDSSLWIHPLSPYYYKDKTTLLPYHPQPGGFTYNNWFTFSMGKESESKPATIIPYFEKNRKERKEQTIISTFGFDMSNAKARCWYEAKIPFYIIDSKIKPEYERVTNDLIFASTIIASNTQYNIKKAWFDNPKDARGDTEYIKFEFYKKTESEFYEILKIIKNQLENNEQNKMPNILKEWIAILKKASEKIFDLYANSGDFENENIQRITLARKSLSFDNNNDKIKTILGIPIEVKKDSAKKESKKK